jgi:DNA-binding transcriptional regulator LsrR (DeoR family)
MARTQRLTKDLDAQAAAYLRAKQRHWLSQAAIGQLLGGLSQSMVSRLLKRAEDLGWLEVTYRFVGEDRLTPERLADLRRLMEPRGLLDVLKAVQSETGVRVREVRVVDSGRAGTTRRAIDASLRRVGRAAAARVGELLRQSDVFAVTWGTTVSHVVDGLAEAPPPLPATRSIRFVPVCAEPLEKSPDADTSTSTHLARRLHGLLQATTDPPPSLTGVPALIARRFREAHAEGIRKYVEGAASYREIFGPRAPLIAKVDSLLTSVGPSNAPMGFIHKELLSAGSMPKKPLTSTRLATLVAGDIGGVLLPKRGLNKQGRDDVENLNAMWTGVKLKHLQRVAQQADRRKRPGVIVVALGADRAEIVSEAVQRGLINELIIDRPLADALARTLSPGRS